MGQYVIHYENGTTAEIPLIYGEDLRDWWNWDQGQSTARAVMAWTGENAQARSNNVFLRLYLFSWKNPAPEKTITQLDFISANAKAAPFCVAITGSQLAE